LPDKILVIDDEPDIRNLTIKTLEEDGYQVISASDGDEGLQKVVEKMPDLILLDVVLPKKSGFEVCKILKKKTSTKHIPILIFTILDREIDMKFARECGAEYQVTKPFDHDSMLTEVRRILNDNKGIKFHKQLGIEHNELMGRKILLEFHPESCYERFIRDFVLESAFHNEKPIVLTPEGSAIRQILKGDEGVEVKSLSPDTMLSDIVEEAIDRPISLVYDNLTDFLISHGYKATFGFAQNALSILSSQDITAIFILNPSAHESKDVYSLRGIFGNRLVYGKQGISDFRFA
jgi:two-component system alkaline phosphatase synthesis response regulator PhoP